MTQVLELVDMASLLDDLDGKAASYRSAEPFPHIVLDDVLTSEAFAAAVRDFPAIRDEFWRGYLHVNETKYANTQPDTWAPSIRSLAEAFCTPEFVDFLQRLTGIDDLIADFTMDGGGLHQTLRDGHLNIHADFTTHHTHQDWARRVNILLYLNEEWPEEWGGQLQLWDKDMQACQATVTPRGNRMLIFTTTVDSFHGHPEGLTCPPDQARRSLAMYYFTREDAPVRRATNYRARPDEKGFKRAAITADRWLVAGYDRLRRRVGDTDVAQRALTRLARLRGKRR
ncbi:hypothetical protein GCM10023340_34200 [Nocardioides marinquilinus]|uniref:Prolyl 4-hydroxylase alpha subunit Fe(2+) 2OG dioxygenase domain-containing protein n=1 Tax=Nocardioides marinquilinus TaxID=1210400 RepID=A0ABP9Q2F7_9ACTN